MTNEMRQKLAREPFEEKILKVSQLIRLAKAVRKPLRAGQDRRSADSRIMAKQPD
jgi:ABC-type sulfate/molybdate transport systems ATPase subunit